METQGKTPYYEFREKMIMWGKPKKANHMAKKGEQRNQKNYRQGAYKMDYKNYMLEKAALDHKIHLMLLIVVIFLIATIILMCWATIKETSSVSDAILFLGTIVVPLLCAIIFGLGLSAPVQFADLRLELRNEAQKEWTIEKKQIIVNLGTENASKLKGTFFLGSGSISSNNEKYYVFAVKSQQGVQLKQTDKQFKDIAFSDIYIQEKAVEKPYYLLEKMKYKDKRVAEILNKSSFFEDEKERLTFVVPPNTIKSIFDI